MGKGIAAKYYDLSSIITKPHRWKRKPLLTSYHLTPAITHTHIDECFNILLYMIIIKAMCYTGLNKPKTDCLQTPQPCSMAPFIPRTVSFSHKFKKLSGLHIFLIVEINPEELSWRNFKWEFPSHSASPKPPLLPHC